MAEPRPPDNTSSPASSAQLAVPAARADRDAIMAAAARYVRDNKLVPPAPLGVLTAGAAEVLAAAGLPSRYAAYAAVMLSNELWRDVLAAVPCNKRLLLVPQCLRSPQCPASVDAMGVLCRQCGKCVIGELGQQARALGYVVLVAEGAGVVMSLIESGQVQAVVGVGCLDVLSRVFPYMEAAAVPGVAIPLLSDGCEGTSLDLDLLWEAVTLSAHSEEAMPNLQQLQAQVVDWFRLPALAAVMGPATSQTEEIARQWLSGAGKRWRPFLAACAREALSAAAPAGGDTDDFRKVAVAVECFHKASLVHDDIEDGDDLRDGSPTVHAQWGVPMALNVGDLLLGEGYRMIAQCHAPDAAKAMMLEAAARGHRTLCLGQGQELAWVRQPTPLSVQQVLEIFRQKTAPAFEVALHLGALYAGADGDIARALTRYSDCLGIAYQIHDDLADFSGGAGDLLAGRPSILLALAHEQAADADRQLLAAAMCQRQLGGQHRLAVEEAVRRCGAVASATAMMEQYRQRAIASLSDLPSVPLRALLRRVMMRIFSDSAAMECCADQPHHVGTAGKAAQGAQ